MSEDMWVFEAHAPLGACDNMTVALKLLANLQEKENFTEVVYESIKVTGRVAARLMQFIEVDNNNQVARLTSSGERVVGLQIQLGGLQRG